MNPSELLTTSLSWTITLTHDSNYWTVKLDEICRFCCAIRAHNHINVTSSDSRDPGGGGLPSI